MVVKYQYRNLSNPDRIEVYDSQNKWLATLIRDAYTVTLAGTSRTFREWWKEDDGSRKEVSVTHDVWVRTLPMTFDGNVDTQWIDHALEANHHSVPDVLAIATQYIKGARKIFEGGLQIAGNASYGPLSGPKKKDGSRNREEGSDFHDYLQTDWKYDDGFIDRPQKRQSLCLDCSGFMRMIWGYRHPMVGYGYEDRVPLCLCPKPDRSAIPRRAYQILDASPGVQIIQNTGEQVTDFSMIGIGDLVFFDADRKDGTLIDHVGMYIGLDNAHRHRFISSRKRANGPTLGDYGGKSVLDGTGLYASSFRAVRRL